MSEEIKDYMGTKWRFKDQPEVLEVVAADDSQVCVKDESGGIELYTLRRFLASYKQVETEWIEPDIELIQSLGYKWGSGVKCMFQDFNNGWKAGVLYGIAKGRYKFRSKTQQYTACQIQVELAKEEAKS